MPNDAKPSPSTYSGSSEAQVVLDGALWADSVVTWDSSTYGWGTFFGSKPSDTYVNDPEA
jgi:hypothetical protein